LVVILYAAGSHLDFLRYEVSRASAIVEPAPTPIPGLACDAAVQTVTNRHTTIFGLLALQFPPMRVVCGERDSIGDVNVYVYWYFKNVTRTATYVVSPSGDVQPADTNAARIDAAAKLSPLVAKVLLAGL